MLAPEHSRTSCWLPNTRKLVKLLYPCITWLLITRVLAMLLHHCVMLVLERSRTCEAFASLHHVGLISIIKIRFSVSNPNVFLCMCSQGNTFYFKRSGHCCPLLDLDWVRRWRSADIGGRSGTRSAAHGCLAPAAPCGASTANLLTTSSLIIHHLSTLLSGAD